MVSVKTGKTTELRAGGSTAHAMGFVAFFLEP
jgi:hypothetical protein